MKQPNEMKDLGRYQPQRAYQGQNADCQEFPPQTLQQEEGRRQETLRSVASSSGVEHSLFF